MARAKLSSIHKFFSSPSPLRRHFLIRRITILQHCNSYSTKTAHIGQTVKRLTNPQIQKPKASKSVLSPGINGQSEAPTTVWPRPRGIQYESEIVNSVTLIGYVEIPIRFEVDSNRGHFATTVISRGNGDSRKSLSIPVVFEGDLAHIVACHVKQDDCVFISGHLCVNPIRTVLIEYTGRFHIAVDHLNFVEGLGKNLGDKNKDVHFNLLNQVYADEIRVHRQLPNDDSQLVSDHESLKPKLNNKKGKRATKKRDGDQIASEKADANEIRVHSKNDADSESESYSEPLETKLNYKKGRKAVMKQDVDQIASEKANSNEIRVHSKNGVDSSESYSGPLETKSNYKKGKRAVKKQNEDQIASEKADTNEIRVHNKNGVDSESESYAKLNYKKGKRAVKKQDGDRIASEKADSNETRVHSKNGVDSESESSSEPQLNYKKGKSAVKKQDEDQIASKKADANEIGVHSKNAADPESESYSGIKLNYKKGRKRGVKKENVNPILNLWRDLVKNPNEWWDYRSHKTSGLVKEKFPDFKKKDNGDSLWMNSAPQWALPGLGQLELDIRKQLKDKIDYGWRKLAENPNKWWDNRMHKTSPQAPDFRHKETGQALWVDNSPACVAALSKMLQDHAGVL